MPFWELHYADLDQCLYSSKMSLLWMTLQFMHILGKSNETARPICIVDGKSMTLICLKFVWQQVKLGWLIPLSVSNHWFNLNRSYKLFLLILNRYITCPQNNCIIIFFRMYVINVLPKESEQKLIQRINSTFLWNFLKCAGNIAVKIFCILWSVIKYKWHIDITLT